MEVGGHRIEIQRLILFRVGNAEAAPEIQIPYWRRQVLSEIAHEINRAALRLGDDGRIEVLLSGEDVEPQDVEAHAGVLAQNLGH